MTEQTHQNRALRLAIENVAAGGGPFGAVIVGVGGIVAEGVNRVTLDNDPTAHAEIVAIRAACAALGRFDLRGHAIYCSCEPCPMCLGAILWARLDRVVYAATREDAAAAGFDDAVFYRELAGARLLPRTRVDTPDALAPFEAWRAFENKRRY